MGWASAHIASLQEGKTVSFRPRGNSMAPRIRSGQLCTVEPVEADDVRKGDIVLCKVRGSEYLHLVKSVQGRRFLIGNNRGGINGWIGSTSVFGRLTKVET
jgi:phage repressor protein C with HTH and peptisase S24 domain